MNWLDCGDDSSRLFDVKTFVPFFSLSFGSSLPVKYWLEFVGSDIAASIGLLLFCSWGTCWDDDDEVDEGGGGAFAFRRAPGDLFNWLLYLYIY